MSYSEKIKDITFGELRWYVSMIDRLSICMKNEDLSYENFMCMRDVPDTYDSYYVYGIGMIESEFYEISEYIYTTDHKRGKLVLLTCMEIMLSEEPKSVLMEREKEKRRAEEKNDLYGADITAEDSRDK